MILETIKLGIMVIVMVMVTVLIMKGNDTFTDSDGND